MVKKACLLYTLLILLFWSCATYQLPPSTLHIDPLPPSKISELSLDERIETEEAWKNLREGRGKKALKLFSKLGERSPFYYVGLGYAYYLLNELQAAETFFGQAVESDPGFIMGHVGLAQIYQDTGREDLAFKQYREILKQDPDHPWATLLYENLRKVKTRDAIADANAYLAEGDTENGKTSLLMALHYSPNQIEAHLGLADIFLQEQNYESAIIHLEAAVTLDPQNEVLLKNYGEALLNAEEYKKALETYEKLQQIDPDDQTIRDQLDMIKNRLGIFELPSQYESIPLSEEITKEQIAALLDITLKDALGEPPQKPPILIDISTSWASRYILRMTSFGLLDVYPNHTFQPQKIVTRAEMAEIIHRLTLHLKQQGYRFIEQIPVEKIHIDDVSPDNFYYQPILMCISYNFMTLSMDKKFKPDSPVSGHEANQVVKLIQALIQ